MDPLALLVSSVVLVAVLVVAAIGSERVRPVYVAVPGAVYLVLVGALGYADAEGAVRQIAPTVGFLVVVLLLAHLADREGVFTWAAAVTARQAGTSAGGLLLRVVVLCAVVTAVLSLDATVLLLTPVVLTTAAHMRVPARPHAWAAGHLANSASLLLPVSNLTNLLAFATTGLSFLHFTGLMLAPWVVAVAIEYLVIRWMFRDDLTHRVEDPVTDVPGPPLLALVVVGLTVIGFGVVGLAGLSPVWPAVAGVLVLAVRRLVLRREDFAAASSWLRGALGRPEPAPAAITPHIDELRRAKSRATQRINRNLPPQPPAEPSRGRVDNPPPPAPPADDPMERLRAARERARRRARGEE